jgi:hypothetical protein
MKNRRTVLLCLIQALAAAAQAKPGADGIDFLNIPVGARAAVLAGAYDPLAVDSFAPIWNPGGLGFLSSAQFSATHLSYVENFPYEATNFAYPLSPAAAAGVSFQYFRPDDVIARGPQGDPAGAAPVSFAAGSLAYGRALNKRVALGAGAKLVRAEMAGVSAQTVVGSVGAMVRATRRARFSAVAGNIGRRLRFFDEGRPLPLSFRTGAAYAATDKIDLTAVGEHRAGETSLQTGLRWRPFESLWVGGGYRAHERPAFASLDRVALGLGVHRPRFGFDYAWAPAGELGRTHQVSVEFRFAPPPARAPQKAAARVSSPPL